MTLSIALTQKIYSSRGLYEYQDLGARKILAQYTGLNEHLCERVSIAHGVDFGHHQLPHDINTPLPIHWSYNDIISQKLNTLKVSLSVAHPWLLMSHDFQPRANTVLVLGPPPGPKNNSAVANKLREVGIKNYDILLKKRGDISDDLNFWANRGVGVVTAGNRDVDFFSRLSTLMSQYENLLAFNTSSALVFAATLGLRTRLISCPLYHYDVENYYETFSADGGLINKFTRIVHDGNMKDICRISEELLGKNRIQTPELARKNLVEANRLAEGNPVFVNPQVRFRRTRIAAAVLTKRKGFLTQNASIERIMSRVRIRKKYVSSFMSNDVDIALNGINEDNFKLRRVEYSKNQTEPGMGQ